MRVGSLFAGVGGFDLGFERAGMATAWQVEIDGKCRDLLARRFPAATQYADVRSVGAHNLAPVDVICGGFPCQDLSVAGKRAGLSGARSGLFYEMVRVIGELRPVWVVWENVPGLFSSGGGRDFLAVLGELDRIGYGGAWTVLDARYFGVAQRRRRVFGVFSRFDSAAERAAQVLALDTRLRGYPPPRGEARPGIAGTPGGGAAGRGRRDNPDSSGAFVASSFAENQRGEIRASAGHHGHSSPRGDGSDNLVAGVVRSNMYNNSDATTEARALVVGPLQAGSATYERGDGSLFCVPTVSPALKARDAKGPSSDGDGDGAPLVPMLSPTLRVGGRDQGAGDSYDNTPTVGVRRLTPTEWERLQGFPDGWTEGVLVLATPEYIAECARKGQVAQDYVVKRFADSHRYRMMGNAVAVPCAEWIGRRIVSH